MRWYYKILGGHTHVRVFMNGGKCGDLCFRNAEFEEIRKDPRQGTPLDVVSVGNTDITFIEEQEISVD